MRQNAARKAPTPHEMGFLTFCLFSNAVVDEKSPNLDEAPLNVLLKAVILFQPAVAFKRLFS
jgi:hypothetical protein